MVVKSNSNKNFVLPKWTETKVRGASESNCWDSQSVGNITFVDIQTLQKMGMHLKTSHFQLPYTKLA